ncbi:MAG: hypothetical protein ABIN67_20480 [Ferruginibacter sp.]
MRYITTVFILIASTVFGLSDHILFKHNLLFDTEAPPLFKGRPGSFSFTLAKAAYTSAGVYTKDSVKVRDLWDYGYYSAGTHTEYWDGTDDFGKQIVNPDSNYIIKVLSNNVKYTWMGTIGNTSTNTTGPTKLRGYYQCSKGMAFGSMYGYAVTGYSEAGPSLYKFAINKPNVKIPLYTSTTNTGDMNFVATDDTITYWGGYDSNSGNNTFVMGTRVSNDVEVPFTGGSLFNSVFGRDYPYAISKMNLANSFISGLAVQKAGIYLFVARAGINQVQVLNKHSGTLVQTLSYLSPKQIAVYRSSLWMIVNGNLNKYSINADGTLSSPILTLSGLINPLSVAVSPNGEIVSVADGGASQQVKHYNASTGAAVTTLGIAGGYQQSALVNNNKFYFTDNYIQNGQYAKQAFIAYQQDGSYWVNDAGNYRVQHYNSSNIFVNRIMSLGASYTSCIDPGNNKRVFFGLLEFEVDYTTGNWTLTKNWGATITRAYNLKYDVKFATLSNGRTYGLINKGGTAEVIELTIGDTIRHTGITKRGMQLSPEGHLYNFLRGGIGTATTMNSFALAGFTDGDPTWSSTPAQLFQTPIITGDDPNCNPRTNSTIVTSTGKLIMYDDHAAKTMVRNRITVARTGYHLGAIQPGTNKWLWKHELSTHINYIGPYPFGRFDVGNGVNDFAGGGQSVYDRYILTSYHGEFWKNSQANYFNLYLDNGLLIGHFGTDRNIVGRGNLAAPGMAGNALTPQLTMHAGKLYLVHGDESDHSGLHLWRIENLNTIVQEDILIAFPLDYIAPVMDYTDLMAGLPFDDTLTNNTAGWTRNPVNDILANPFTNFWQVRTSALEYDKRKPVDLFMRFALSDAGTCSVSRDLGTDKISHDWKIAGSIEFLTPGGTLNGQANNLYVEVLDDAGKLLAQMYADRNLSAYPTISYRVQGNDTQLFSMTSDSLVSSIQRFDIVYNAGKIKFNYGGYTRTTKLSDPTANGRNPKTLRFRFNNNGSKQVYPFRTSFLNGRFYKDVL